jgi:uncharacterized membrane protein YdjX (TVP38/TMEM64 family)
MMSKRMARFFLLAVFVVAMFLIVRQLPVQNLLAQLFDWTNENPALSVLVFFGFVLLAMVLLFPVSIQAMAAGFLFGLKGGFIIMWMAGLLGFVAAFLIGRGAARPWVQHWVRLRPEFEAIDKAVGKQGLVLVILARLAQILPYNMLNYAFGLTSVSLRDYTFGSAIGMVPGIFMFVFFGSTAIDIASVMTGGTQLKGYTIYIAGFGILAVAVAVTLIARTANAVLRNRIAE